jgi:hypothetical protein
MPAKSVTPLRYQLQFTIQPSIPIDPINLLGTLFSQLERDASMALMQESTSHLETPHPKVLSTSRVAVGAVATQVLKFSHHARPAPRLTLAAH